MFPRKFLKNRQLSGTYIYICIAITKLNGLVKKEWLLGPPSELPLCVFLYGYVVCNLDLFVQASGACISIFLDATCSNECAQVRSYTYCVCIYIYIHTYILIFKWLHDMPNFITYR